MTMALSLHIDEYFLASRRFGHFRWPYAHANRQVRLRSRRFLLVVGSIHGSRTHGFGARGTEYICPTELGCLLSFTGRWFKFSVKFFPRISQQRSTNFCFAWRSEVLDLYL